MFTGWPRGFNVEITPGGLRPLLHLLGEWAVRAVGIVLKAEVFVNLKQTLLVRDGLEKKRAAWIVAEETRGAGFEPAVRQAGR